MLVPLTLLALTMGLWGSASPSADNGPAKQASPQRIEDIARRGEQVMPFDLERTQHLFDKDERGGRQRVVVKDPADTEQIRLVREHLSAITTDFQQGRFTEPANIHGTDMPGLQELGAARSGALQISFHEIPLGGEIRYRSDRPVLVDALHRWFDAQVSDHGLHAIYGHQHQ